MILFFLNWNKIFSKKNLKSSFIDQTTQSATFTYSSNNSKLQLKRVDVLATPDELYSKVKSVFMQATMNKNDTIIVKKLYWQTNKYFQVATITMLPKSIKNDKPNKSYLGCRRIIK